MIGFETMISLQARISMLKNSRIFVDDYIYKSKNEHFSSISVPDEQFATQKFPWFPTGHTTMKLHKNSPIVLLGYPDSALKNRKLCSFLKPPTRAQRRNQNFSILQR